MKAREAAVATEERKEPLIPFNLQFFAKDGEGDAGDDNGGDDDAGDEDEGDEDDTDQDGDSGDNNDTKAKKFSQEDVDNVVKKRLEKERRKWQRQQQKSGQDSKGGTDGKDGDSDKGETEEARKVREENEKLATKVICLEQGVDKDSVDDVVALARAYVDDDTDIEDAIEKVLKKYPQFTGKKKGQEDDTDQDTDQTQGRSWGKRQNGAGSKQLSGVEAAFYRKNPGLKPTN